MSPAVFISRIRGLAVLDARGEEIGKVRDAVVQARVGKNPRVRGLVVELFARRQIFMPMIRVRYVDATQIVVGGQVDTRRFERRASEVLVVEDLFDRVVQRIVDGKAEKAAVYDVAMSRVRNRDWALTEMAIRPILGKRFGLTQYGPVIIRPWTEIAQYVWTDRQSVDSKIAELSDMHPADAARELHDMEPERRSEVVHALDDAFLADAFQELSLIHI